MITFTTMVSFTHKGKQHNNESLSQQAQYHKKEKRLYLDINQKADHALHSAYYLVQCIESVSGTLQTKQKLSLKLIGVTQDFIDYFNTACRTSSDPLAQAFEKKLSLSNKHKAQLTVTQAKLETPKAPVFNDSFEHPPVPNLSLVDEHTAAPSGPQTPLVSTPRRTLEPLDTATDHSQQPLPDVPRTYFTLGIPRPQRLSEKRTLAGNTEVPSTFALGKSALFSIISSTIHAETISIQSSETFYDFSEAQQNAFIAEANILDVLHQLAARYQGIVAKLDAPNQQPTQDKLDLVNQAIRDISTGAQSPQEAAHALLNNKQFTQAVRRPGFEYTGMTQGSFFKRCTGKTALQEAVKSFEQLQSKMPASSSAGA